MNTKKNQGVLDYVDDGVALFEKTWKRIAGVEAISMVVSAVILVVTVVVFFIFLGATLFNDALLTEAMLTGDAATYLTSGLSSQALLSAGIILLISGIALTMVGVAMDLAKIMVLMKKVPFVKSFGFGIKNMWKGFLIVLSKQLLVLVAMVCVGLPVFVLLNALIPVLGLEQWSPLSWGSFAAILFAVILLLLPIVVGLVMTIRFYFVLFVWAENQNLRIWSVIKQSFALTKGSVFWTVVLLYSMVVVASWIVSFFFSLVGPLGLLLLIATIILVITPMYWAMQYALYEYAKQRHGGAVKKNA